MIKEDYVSFETAKLLKEKGFVVPYDSFRGVYINGKFLRLNPGQGYLHNIGDEIINVCSLQMAMKWLREKFNINPVPYALSLGWAFDIFDLSNRDISGCKKLFSMDLPSKSECYKTYEEACESAIRYTLENLI